MVEDVVRFVLDDAQLTALAKDLRHTLATLLAQGPLPHRVALRDVAGDVGIGVEPPVSLRRVSPKRSPYWTSMPSRIRSPL